MNDQNLSEINLPEDLRKLHAAAHLASKRFGYAPDCVFDFCGLLLELPPVTNWCDYWCTPSNVVTFAHTGGDSVHYSYLRDASFAEGVCPIVMTMPAASGINVVLAESFNEFFSLGYYVGWFSLEQLVYQPEWAEKYFSAPNPDFSELSADTLDFLRQNLSIQAGPPRLVRLRELHEKYHGLLQIGLPPEGS